VIAAIKEALRGKLTSIASILLSSEHTKLEDLSEEEQDLWKQFDNSDIYEFITGEQDTLQGHRPNLCNSLVLFPSTFYFANQETDTYRFYLFTTGQTTTTLLSYGKLRGLHLHQPHQNPV
jgi:hypothetical protein